MSAFASSALEECPIRHSESHIRAIHEAAEWYACLRSDDVSADQQQAWEAWYAADPEHQAAWLKIEQVSARLGVVPGRLAGTVLARSTRGVDRRVLLRGVFGLAAVGAGGALAYRLMPTEGLQYDLVTGTGERRQVQLADGSILSINAGSRVDIEFTSKQRLVRLYEGEILVTTHPDNALVARPFVVETAHGRVLALGTRFNVRAEGGLTRVAVLEKAVEATPGRASGLMQRIEAGQQLSFSEAHIGSLQIADISAGSWASGRLVVVNMPLRQFLAELSRYRRGHIGCDDTVADLPISGAYPIDDTEQALLALTEAFPLRLNRFTRYWVDVVRQTTD